MIVTRLQITVMTCAFLSNEEMCLWPHSWAGSCIPSTRALTQRSYSSCADSDLGVAAILSRC